MKKIRIYKDFACIWHILTNGEETSLAGRDLTLYLVTPYTKKKVTDFTTEGNSIRFMVGHELHEAVGIYGLELWENKGKAAQTIADLPQAFCLVKHSTDEEGEAAANLETETAVHRFILDLYPR